MRCGDAWAVAVVHQGQTGLHQTADRHVTRKLHLSAFSVHVRASVYFSCRWAAKARLIMQLAFALSITCAVQVSTSMECGLKCDTKSDGAMHLAAYCAAAASAC
jgi:hypothetical protein